ncbi:hypothetical protein EXIGLDRAFT_690523 [Exidia glandulosa HHB12029]|uniref:Mid2 domain-containing protein n=1 Tax=Exidia glandulosa HHB12029 TaxID=1314781 RepID=A0A166BSR4_EXIGL|nr:hypothetical protein EXIGLDRAFT_690523 [Exidia glandulosa HHB12029]
MRFIVPAPLLTGLSASAPHRKRDSSSGEEVAVSAPFGVVESDTAELSSQLASETPFGAEPTVLPVDTASNDSASVSADSTTTTVLMQPSSTSSTSDSTTGTGQTAGPTSASKTTPPSTSDSPSSGQATKSVLPDPHRTPVVAIVVPIVAVLAIVVGVTAYICLRRRRRRRREQQAFESHPQPYRDGMPYTAPLVVTPVLAKKEALGLGASDAEPGPASQSLSSESSAQHASVAEPEEGVTVAELGSAMRRAGLTVNNLLASLAVRPSETAAQTSPPSYYD